MITILTTLTLICSIIFVFTSVALSLKVSKVAVKQQ